MDDTPDKLRRNVVVLSAAIVAITIFHLSFTPKATLLGFAEVGTITPLKVWLALSAVLGYVFLRYWFHDDTTRERAALADHYRGLRYAALQRCLGAEIERYFMRQCSPRWLADFDDFSDAKILPGRLAELGRPTSIDAVATITHAEHSPWQGDVGYSFVVAWAGRNECGHSDGKRYAYSLSNQVAFLIRARCALRTGTWSKSAVDLLVPIVLAGAAGIMCAYQLARAVSA
jgi:hypothetical protein